jgi:hypothetical protein
MLAIPAMKTASVVGAWRINMVGDGTVCQSGYAFNADALGNHP